MRFSRRTPEDFAPSSWSRLAEERRRSGKPLYDLTDTNPARLGLLPPAMPEARRAVEVRAPYEPEPLGARSAREAIVRYFGERSLPAAADRVLLTTSTSEAYAHLFRVLADPGDEFLVPQPSYPLFQPLADLECVRLVPYPLRLERGEWRPELGALAQLAGLRTRGVLVVHPNNPTGSLFTPEEAERLETLCAERNLALVADEVFTDFVYVADRHASFALSRRALTFVLGGLSKTCGQPAVKLAWTLVAGPPALVSKALSRLEWVGDLFLSPSDAAQAAAPALLAGRRGFLDAARTRVRANEEALRCCLDEVRAFTLLPVHGGWSAVLRLEAGADEEEWVRRLLERGVLVHPGHFYDFPEGAHVVVSLLLPPADFARAAELIGEAAQE